MTRSNAQGLATIQVVNRHLRVVRMVHIAALLAVVALSACTSSTGPSTTPSSASGAPQPSPKLTTYTPPHFAPPLAPAPGNALFYAQPPGPIHTLPRPPPPPLHTLL